MNPSHSMPAADYPYLRQCLAPQFADAAAEDIESYMDGRFGEGAASHYDECLESFFSDLGRTFQKVAPVVANVAGGVAHGAMSGSSLGLPGIIGGAVMGGAGTALSSYAKGPLRDVGNVLNTGTQIASQFSPMGRMGNQLGSALSGLGQGRITPQRLLQQGSQLLTSAVPGMGGGASSAMGVLMGGGGGGGGPMAALAGLLGRGGGGAAGQLGSLLGRPEVQQALMALSMGPAGRRTVPVGHTQMPVPSAAIAGLLQNLSAQAVSEAAAFSDGSESELSYMADADGEFVGDPAEEDDRAARLWDLLNHAQLERLTAHAHQAVLVAHQAQAAQAAHAARQARAAPDWRSLLTEDLLQGLGELDAEFDGEADTEYAEYAEDSEADTEVWTPETHHAWR